MNTRSKAMNRDEFELAVEAYVDGELAADERLRLEQYLALHPEGSEELELAERLRDELRSWPERDVPLPVLRQIKGLAVARPRSPAWRPALWLAAAALVLALGLWPRFFGPQGGREEVLEAQQGGAAVAGPLIDSSAIGVEKVDVEADDLQQAESEVRYALQLLAEIGGKAGSGMRREITRQTADRMRSQLGRYGVGQVPGSGDKES